MAETSSYYSVWLTLKDSETVDEFYKYRDEDLPEVGEIIGGIPLHCPLKSLGEEWVAGLLLLTSSVVQPGQFVSPARGRGRANAASPSDPAASPFVNRPEVLCDVATLNREGFAITARTELLEAVRSFWHGAAWEMPTCLRREGYVLGLTTHSWIALTLGILNAVVFGILASRA